MLMKPTGKPKTKPVTKPGSGLPTKGGDPIWNGTAYTARDKGGGGDYFPPMTLDALLAKGVPEPARNPGPNTKPGLPPSGKPQGDPNTPNAGKDPTLGPMDLTGPGRSFTDNLRKPGDWGTGQQAGFPAPLDKQLNDLSALLASGNADTGKGTPPPLPSISETRGQLGQPDAQFVGYQPGFNPFPTGGGSPVGGGLGGGIWTGSGGGFGDGGGASAPAGGFTGAPNYQGVADTYMQPPPNYWDGNNFVIGGLEGGARPMTTQPIAAPIPVSFQPPAQQQPSAQPPAVGGFDIGSLSDAVGAMQPEQMDQIRSLVEMFLPQTPEVDLSGIQGQLDALNERVGSIPAPQEVSFDPVLGRIGELEARVSNMFNQPVAEPDPVDFSPILDRIGGLEQQFASIPQPDINSILDQRFGSLQGSLDQRFNLIEGRFQEIPRLDQRDLELMQRDIMSGIDERFSQLPQPTPQLDIDLSPLQNQLTDLSGRFDQFQNNNRSDLLIGQFDQLINPIQDQLGQLNDRVSDMRPQEVSFDPILERIGGLENRLNNLPQPQEIDLSGINQRLDQLAGRQGPDLSGIQNQLGQLTAQMNRPMPEVDYNQIGSMLDQRLSNLPQPERVDLSGIQNQLGELSGRFNSLDINPQVNVDLSGINQRLDQLASRPGPDLSGINSQLGSIQSQLSRPAPEVDYGRINSMLQGAQPDLSGINQQLGQLTAQQPAAAPEVDYNRINQMVQQAISGLQLPAYNTSFGGF